MKRTLILITLLICSCGDNNTYQNSQDKNHLSKDQVQQGHTNSYSSKVLAEPNLYDFKAKTFISKKDTFLSTDKKYIQVSSKLSMLTKKLNHQTFPEGLRIVVIEGKDLVFQKEHFQGLFEQIHSAPDIETLRIYADTVEIKDYLKIPSTKVEIYAKRLLFSSKGAIDVSPLNLNHRALQFKSGEHGLSATEIKLFVESIEIIPQRAGPIFILNGGSGQDAGLGQKGANGSRLRDLGGGLVFVSNTKNHCVHIDTVRHMRDKRLHCNPKQTFKGTDSWPSDGSPGIPGGSPGDAGDGGVLYSTVDISERWISFLPGVSGQVSTISSGGDPGTPLVSYHETKHFRESTRRVSRTSSKGANILSPTAKISIGKKGKVLSIDNKLSWINEKAIKHSLKFANDLYLNNHIIKAKKEFQKLGHVFNQIEESKVFKSLSLISDFNLLSVNTNKIEGQLDYYGHKVTWIPNLSLETYYSRFEKEIDESIKIIYLSYWITNTQTSLEEKIWGLRKLQDQIEISLEVQSEQINIMNEKVPLLKSEIDKFRVNEEHFKNELLRVEKEIEEMAKSNVISRNKESFLKKTLKTAALLSKIIPAGQPALGSVGVGLDSLIKLSDSDRPLNTLLDEVPELYNSYKDFNYMESKDNWNESWSKIKISKFRSLSNEKDRKEFIQDVINFSKPILKGIRRNTSIWKDRQTPRGEVELEIEKIKNSDPLFTSIIKNLNEILLQKEALNFQIQVIDKGLGESLVEIQKSFVKLGSLSSQSLIFSRGDDKKFIPLIEEMKHEAEIRLQKYQYHLIKAYEYRVLRKYTRNLNIKPFINKIIKLVKVDQIGELGSKQFDQLKALYIDSLSSIAFETLEKFEEDGVPQQREKIIYLSTEEIEALNEGKLIYLDLIGQNVFNSDFRDIRINNIIVEDLSVESSFEGARIAEVSLNINSYGKSYINKEGNYYLYEEDVSSKSQKKWGASLDAISNTLFQIESSEGAMSLMKVLLGENGHDSINLFSRIGALTQLEVSLSKHVLPIQELKVKDIAIKIIYDYSL